MNLPTTHKRSLAEILAERKALAAARVGLVQDSLLAAEPLEEAPISHIAAPSEPMNPTTPQNPLIKRLVKENSEVEVPETSLITTTSVAPITPPVPSLPKKKLSFKELLALKLQNKTYEAHEPREILATKQGEALGSPHLETVPTIPTVPTIKETILETVPPVAEILEQEEYKGAFSLSIELNSQQLLAKDMAFAGKSFCLVGAAGTGKTTAQREVARSLLESKQLSTHDFRIQGTRERAVCPSIAFVAYTRVASGNLRRAIHKLPELEAALQHNVTTIHNLLEYQPETYWDYEDNVEKFRFAPKRTAANPLDITHLVIEESSMVGLDLWEKLYAALREGTQIIFIGDINQLPPVFGDSILNYALVQLPVVELTHVYRQAGDSTILENAHNILAGKAVVEAEDYKIVRCGTTNHTQAKLATSLGVTFEKWRKAGAYDPTQDIILSPWNKRDLGTDNMNKWVAQYLGVDRKAVVFEVIAGITKLYLAVGDKIMYNKQVGVITRIAHNTRYMGKAPLPESVNLNRFGTYTGSEAETEEDLNSMDYSNLDLDKMILESDQGDRTKEASHHVYILLDDGGEEELSAIGDFSPSSFSLAYALTVHKAQGCEWRKVFLILHRDHSISLSRELFYTANTRAREQMVVIAKDEIITKAIAIQRIKGNTIKEKIEYFNSGISLNNAVKCTK